MYLAHVYLLEHLPTLDISSVLYTANKKAIRLVDRAAATPPGGENAGETGRACPIAS